MKQSQLDYYEQSQEVGNEALKHEEIAKVLEQVQDDMSNLQTTIEDQDFASTDNIVAQFDFFQQNPTLADLIEKHNFHIDYANKRMKFTITLLQNKGRKDYDIEITKKGLTVDGKIITEFLDGHYDQIYSNKPNSKEIFQSIKDWFKTSRVINQPNEEHLQPKVQKKIEDAAKVFQALIEKPVQ